MTSATRMLALVGLLFLGVLTGEAADPPQPTDTDRMPRADGEMPLSEDGDSIKLPPGAKSVVLTREKYENLLDEIRKLQKTIEKLEGKPATPSACRVTGQVIEGNLVRLHVQFDFEVDKNEPKRVLLGCSLANPTEAKLDGQLGLFKKTDEGFVVLVDKAGVHQATLDMELTLNGKDNERGFALDLPPAVTKSLELTLPKDVKNARVGKEVFETRTSGESSVLKPPGLDWPNRLEVAWNDQVNAQASPPQMTVDTRLVVRVDQKQVITDAEMSLRVAGGQTTSISLIVPPQAEFIRKPMMDDRIISVDVSDAARSLRTLRIKEAGTKPFLLAFKVVQQRGKDGIPIGPFGVQGATSQQGDILFSVPSDLRCRYLPRYSSERALTEEDRRREPDAVAAFRYYGLPSLDKSSDPGTAVQPPLEIEIEPIRGEVEAKVSHTLRLVQPLQGERPFWRVITTIEGEALRTRLSMLAIQLPAGYTFDETVGMQPSAMLQGPPIIEPLTRIAHIPLAYSKPGPFKLTMEGSYAPADSGPPLVLGLPKPLGALDRGGNVTIQLPESLEWIRANSDDSERELLAQEPHRWAWGYRRYPSNIELNWQPYRSELLVRAVADLTVTGREVRVRQRFSFEPSGSRPRKVVLEVPRSAHSLEVKEGGTLESPLQRRAPVCSVVLGPSSGSDSVLELGYLFDLPEETASEGKSWFTVPLVTVRDTTRGETRVRVWTSPGTGAVPVGASWEQLRPESDSEHASLPTLVVRCNRSDLPLRLALNESTDVNLATVGLDRALIEVRVDEDGYHSYRARYRLGRLATRYLDVELPRAPSTLGLKTFFDGKSIAWRSAGDSTQTADGDKVARVPVPALPGQKTSIFEVRYQTAPGQSATWFTASQLQPPLLRGTADRAPVRWQVILPPHWLALDTEPGYRSEQSWVLRRGLLTPQPIESSDALQRWLLEPDHQAGETLLENNATSFVTGWRTEKEPFRLICVPRQIWLLSCSVSCLVLGLGVYLMARRRALSWLLFFPLGLAVAFIALVWPGLLAALAYGSEPGFAIMALILVVQWLWQRRYRRKLMFMPGFTRLKIGSAPMRGGVAASRTDRRPGEPSTVDVPKVMAGSSLVRLAATEKPKIAQS
ncbi:MAG: hypothetical protein ACJ8FY_04495 [Gemmataceae bacterium]